MSEWLHKLWYMYTMYITQQWNRNRLFTHAASWVSLQRMMLSRKRQSLKDACYASPFIQHSWITASLKWRTDTWLLRGKREREKGKSMAVQEPHEEPMAMPQLCLHCIPVMVLEVAQHAALQTLPLRDSESQNCFLQAWESILLSKGEGWLSTRKKELQPQTFCFIQNVYF